MEESIWEFSPVPVDFLENCMMECSDEPNKNVTKSFLQKQGMETLIKRFKADLHHCASFINDSKKMKDSIRELYTKYVHQSDTVSQDLSLLFAHDCPVV